MLVYLTPNLSSTLSKELWLQSLRPSLEDFPMAFQIAERLDGSGSHTIYSQHGTNTSIKSFILFCSKTVVIKTSTCIEQWKIFTPNSPIVSDRFSFVLLKKINTDKMTSEGLPLRIMNIIRSLFASRQLCTAKHCELKNREIVIQGFTINRHISDDIELFGELEDSESIISLPSNKRVNITHLPISTIHTQWPK